MEKPVWLQIIEGEKQKKVGKIRLPDFQFKEIPVEILELDWLVELDLSFNEISRIDHLDKLTNLKVLNLSQNRISRIENLSLLKELEYLNLSSNAIREIENLENLGLLTWLSLANNEIERISNLDALNLSHLDLSNNRITTLKPIEKKIRYGLNITIRDNPIIEPPIEIVKQGDKAIINYFNEINEQGEETVYEAKVIIIGDAGVGKTTLTRKIIDINALLPRKIDTTVGIDIKTFIFEGQGAHPDYKLYIWDLGGQDVYLPIHQLFFSNRCLYILLDDGRKENKLESFWLPAQELFGGESTVLIMHNKQGDLQPYVPFNILKSRFENIKGELWNIDLFREPEKIIRFRDELKYQFTNLPQFVKEQKLPASWARIKSAIESISANFIYLSEVKNIFQQLKIPDAEKQEFILDYLHDLGIILRYKDILHPLLNKFIILKPQWALEAIYKVLKHTRENKRHGIFKYDELAEIWEDNKYSETIDELLSLMKRLELCYPLNEREYLIPSLLPSDIPYKAVWDNTETTMVKYEYDFMPRGIISRLIVRLHSNIDASENMWREGVVFEFEGNKAMVCNIAEKRIEVSAKGLKPSVIISIITREIEAIHKEYKFNNKINVTKKVPCVCGTCKESTSPTYFDHSDLLKRKEFGKKTIECKTPPNYEDVLVEQLLENIDSNHSNKRHKKDKNMPLKAFISYSKYDGEETRDGTNYLEEFKEMLSPLIKHLKLIEDWDDTKLIAGENWDKKIRDELKSCDIIFVLLSNSFLNTNYIIETELMIACQREQRGECIIVPVVIRDCGWAEISWLSSLSALPRKGHTISSWASKWKSKDQAWKHVLDETKKLVLSFKQS